MTELSKTFKQRLSEISKEVPGPERITAREAVREGLREIHQARNKRVPWDAIAEVVRTSVESTYGVLISLSGYTVKRYYYELTSSNRKKVSKSRSRPTKQASGKSSAPVPATTPTQAEQPTALATTPETVSTPEPAARSPAAKPESPGKAPAVDESPAPETQEETSTEELHPNRFRDRFKTVKNPRTTTGYENCKSL
jgi:hypothetical protein